MDSGIEIPCCGCGCGQPTKKSRRGTYNSYRQGHNSKNMSASQTSKNQHPRQFQPGNKLGKGRPVGSRNAVTIATENLIQGEGEALTRKLIELALAGNVACLKTAIERIVPVCKSKPVNLPDMPRIQSIADASALTGFVIDAVADGRVSPVEGEILSRSCERHLKALEVRDLEQRIVELEQQMSEKQR